ncbi:hypothetical protein [Salinibacter ruber]|uniref:hypothetical protein n=1 Tax=Salinibacter ruber TaxID=146919 RepID=UPI0013C37B63|nr:hypothetical protein [Salinibacter ruber]
MPPSDHSPCLLHQYLNRVGTRLYKLLDNGGIEAENLSYESLVQGRILLGEGAIWTRGGVARIDVSEQLAVVDQTAAGPWVKRKNYSYHATLVTIEDAEEVGNIRRYDSPHDSLSGPDYHFEHHVHCYWPFSDKDEEIWTLEEEGTPTLAEFVEDILEWQENHYEELKPSGWKEAGCL